MDCKVDDPDSMLFCIKCEEVFCSEHFGQHVDDVRKKGEPSLVKYKNQISSMETFGLTDLNIVIPALEKHNGDMEKAIATIFDTGNENNSNENDIEESVEKTEEKVDEHLIFFNCSTSEIRCYECNERINPILNIHGMGYRYFCETKNRNPSPIYFTENQFIHNLENKKMVFSEDKKFENEELLFLFRTLFDLIQLGGHSGTEEIVSDYIQKFLEDSKLISENPKNKERNIRVLRDKNFGICVIEEPDNKEESDEENIQTIVLDAHIDQVSTTHIQPIIFNDDIFTCCGTGFDNRISVAVQLTLLKYLIPKNMRIIYLFSCLEESGFRGFEHFFLKEEKTLKMFRDEFCRLDEIICMDVHYGMMKTGEMKDMLKLAVGGYFDFLKFWYNKDMNLVPIIGNGICINFENKEKQNKFENSHKDFIKKFKNEKEEEEEEGEELSKKNKNGVNADDQWNGKILTQNQGIEKKNEFRSTNIGVMNYKEFKDKYGSFGTSKGACSALVVDMHEDISFTSLVDVWRVYKYMKLRCQYT